MSIIVIGGCPGTGKTTLARELSKRSPNGVHLVTDNFFDFLSHKVDPSTKPAQHQNEIVLSAWCAAARSYDAGGYDVFVDGVIGPWWLPILDRELGEYRYIMLQADLDICLRRVEERDGQSSATPAVVRRMHEQFSTADQSSLLVLDSTQSLENLAEEVLTVV